MIALVSERSVSEVNVKGVMKKSSMTGFVMLVGSMMTVGLPGTAVAKSTVDSALAQTAHGCGVTHTASGAKAMLASLRYFGGPKSPMWR